MTYSIQTSSQTDSTPLLERIRGSAADHEIYKLAKSLFTKIGDFLSSCMSFCKERFNAFKEKVSPSHQQHERRSVRHLTLEDDEGTELAVFQQLDNAASEAVNAEGLNYSEALYEDGTELTVFQDAVNAEGLNYSGALVPFIDLEQRVLASLIKILRDKVHFGKIPKFPFSVNQQINQSLPNTSPQSQALVLYVDLEKRTIASFLDILRDARPSSHELAYQAVVGKRFLPAPQNTSFNGIEPN